MLAGGRHALHCYLVTRPARPRSSRPASAACAFCRRIAACQVACLLSLCGAEQDFEHAYFMPPLMPVRRVGARVLLVTQAPPSLPAPYHAAQPPCVSQALRGLLCCAAVETAATVAACGGAQAVQAATGAEAQHVISQYGVAADAGLLSAPLLLPARPLRTPPVPGVRAPLSSSGPVLAPALLGAARLCARWEDPDGRPEECRALSAGSLGALAVTGGLGALGRLVTVWAAGRTPRLLLTGRSGRPALGPPLAGLASWRCVAVQARCDLGTQEDRRQLVRFSPSTYIHAGAAGFADCLISHCCSPGNGLQQLSGLQCVWYGLHPQVSVRQAGGALHDALLSKQTALALRAAHAPKAGGCAMLRQCLRGCPLETAVLFSSLAALLGSAGQANYASANAALDGEAEALGTMVRIAHVPPCACAALDRVRR